MAVSPQAGSAGALRMSVLSEGQLLADTVMIRQVQVRHGIGTIPEALIVVGDGEMATNQWPVADAAMFEPGSAITIKAGYGDDAEQVIFDGIVVRLGVRIGASDSSCLQIVCHDRAVAMTFDCDSTTYVDRTDGEIIEGLIGAHGLLADVDDTAFRHRALAQYQCSDWDFMLSRADANGLMVIADGGRISVRAPSAERSPVLAVSWGTDLFDFDADIDARSQVRGVKATAWDPAVQAIVAGTAAGPLFNTQGNLDSGWLADRLGRTSLALQGAAGSDEAALDAVAKAKLLRLELARIRGRMSFQGSALARVAGWINLSGVGARYSGDVFISSVTHEIADGNWITRAEFGLPESRGGQGSDVVRPSAPGWLPGVAGLQIGIVMKLEDDPMGEHRVKVEIPLLEAEEKGVWARLLHHHASRGFGSFHVPEVGDEVVVGYFNDDPSSPVVLGSLYSSRNAPPYAMEARNGIKAIVTRSKTRIEIDDDNAVVTIGTPSGNRVVIGDKDAAIELADQNGNRVTLDASGISFDSAKDIRLSAKGTITAHAVQGIDLSTAGDMSAAGLNVTVEAQASMRCQGGSTAELSSAAQTVVRGAIVMIN